MLQIGLTGLLAYVKASQRSAVIDELLLSKDYISEIIAMAADHFPTVSSRENSATADRISSGSGQQFNHFTLQKARRDDLFF